MKVTANPDIDRSKPEDQPKYLSLILDQIVQAINGRLSLADNFDAKILTVVFTSANVNVATTHGLGRVPSSYIVLSSTAATNVYDGSSANTTQLIYLRASAVATVKVLVF